MTEDIVNHQASDSEKIPKGTIVTPIFECSDMPQVH